MSTLQDAQNLLPSLSRAEKAILLQQMIAELGDAFPGVESRPDVCGGEPCLVRTRIPVWLLEQARRLGTSEAALLTGYPTLHAQDLTHAWAYARAYRADIDRQIQDNTHPVPRSCKQRQTQLLNKVNIAEKMALFSGHFSPKVVGALNGQHVKLVKFQGEFVWHRHEQEDELFLVVKGRFRMELRGQEIDLHEGEFLIVPRTVEHRPVAETEVQVLLFEPASTLNTGDVVSERTVYSPDTL